MLLCNHFASGSLEADPEKAVLTHMTYWGSSVTAGRQRHSLFPLPGEAREDRLPHRIGPTFRPRRLSCQLARCEEEEVEGMGKVAPVLARAILWGKGTYEFYPSTLEAAGGWVLRQGASNSHGLHLFMLRSTCFLKFISSWHTGTPPKSCLIMYWGEIYIT